MNKPQDDLSHLKNILLALEKGKWELTGLEILAMSNSMRFMADLYQKMSAEINAPPIKPTEAPPLTEQPQEAAPQQPKAEGKRSRKG